MPDRNPTVVIWYGSGSNILGWIPIRIQSGSRVLMQGVFLSATNSVNMQGVRLYKCQTVRHPISPTKIQYAGNCCSYVMFITTIAVFFLPTGNDILYIPWLWIYIKVPSRPPPPPHFMRNAAEMFSFDPNPRRAKNAWSSSTCLLYGHT